MTAPVNGPLVRQLRIAARLGLSRASQLAGVRKVVLERIENDHQGVEANITLLGLCDLAAALGTTPKELLRDQHDDPTPAPRTPDSAPNDAATLAGLLVALRFQVPIRDVASALRWEPSRVQVAYRALREALANTGLSVTHQNASLQLVPTERQMVDEAELSLRRTRLDRRGMDVSTARTLARAIAGTYDRGGRRSMHTESRLIILERLGAITRRDGKYSPTEALLFALDQSDR